MPAPQSSAIEADKLSPYLVFLFFLLSTATLFDGFDAAMFSFAAPDVRSTLGISREQWGIVSGITRIGVMASFLFMMSADRIGRRNVMMLTIVGFAIANGATAFVTTPVGFIAAQFVARLFLTAEYALAIIMISEEYPARLRGRAIAILTSLATIGVMMLARVQAFILLEPGEEGGWLHSLGQSIVVGGQQLFGLEVDHENWRALYVLGAFPLMIVLGLRLAMRETRRFEATVRESRGAVGLRDRLRHHWEDAKRPWQPRYRRQTAVVTLLWNCVHLVTGPSTIYWVIFAREDLGLTPSNVGSIVFYGYGGGVAGHFVAGYLIDRIGRKWTCSMFYVAAGLAIYQLFHVPTLTGQYVWMIATVFSFGAANTATHVYASELFPTEIRATGYGWTTNLLGRVTEVVTPMAIGLLIAPLGGIPGAISIVAVGPILGAVLVMRYAPETRGLTLEQVQERLAESG
jgi:putative MFS transporter